MGALLENEPSLQTPMKRRDLRQTDSIGETLMSGENKERVSAWIVAIAVVMAVSAPAAFAASSFGEVTALHSNAATDHVTEGGIDYAAVITSAPNGTVIATWYSTDFGDVLATPEWSFKKEQLKKFGEIEKK